MKKHILIHLKEFILGILAGLSISIGCIAFLSSGNKIIGALFFVIGLFMILSFNFNLFTGKVCYTLDNKPSYLLKLVTIWVGNFVGTLICASIIRLTRLSSLIENANALCQVKLNDSIVSLFFLAVLCNILIFLAVYGFKNFDNMLSQTLALFFGVSVFVLCGFEHCVADMFYFFVAGAWSWRMIGYLLIITLGNCVGGLLFPFLNKIIKYIDKNNTNVD